MPSRPPSASPAVSGLWALGGVRKGYGGLRSGCWAGCRWRLDLGRSSRSSVSAAEKGQLDPRLSMIAEALGVPSSALIDDLLPRDETGRDDRAP
jgi:hypothetical protein